MALTGGKGSAKAPKLPTAAELAPLIDLQAQANRVGVETPFGSQTYRKNPDGTTTLVTDVGQPGKDLVGRAVGLGMTDSAPLQMPGQLNDLASALAGRIGGRLGVDLFGPMSLSQTPQRAQKPQTPSGAPPTPGLPSAGGMQDPASNRIGGNAGGMNNDARRRAAELVFRRF